MKDEYFSRLSYKSLALNNAVIAYFEHLTYFHMRSYPADQSINIRVGNGDSAKTFLVNKRAICKFSGYCQRRCTSGWQDEIDLEQDDPVVFDLFFQWTQCPVPPISYDPDGESKEPWLSNSAAAWILAKKLQTMEQFKKYALAQFIQGCALLVFGPWELIEREAPPKSPLRRFSDHWIAWNSRLSGPGPNEFSGLHAAHRAGLVPKMARDPRIYDIEHWYSGCGDDMSPGCAHDPITRQEKIDEANRPPLAPLAEWGHSFEAQRTGLPLAPGDAIANLFRTGNVRTTSNPSPPMINVAVTSTKTYSLAQETFAKACVWLFSGVSFPAQP